MSAHAAATLHRAFMVDNYLLHASTSTRLPLQSPAPCCQLCLSSELPPPPNCLSQSPAVPQAAQAPSCPIVAGVGVRSTAYPARALSVLCVPHQLAVSCQVSNVLVQRNALLCCTGLHTTHTSCTHRKPVSSAGGLNSHKTDHQASTPEATFHCNQVSADVVMCATISMCQQVCAGLQEPCGSYMWFIHVQPMPARCTCGYYPGVPQNLTPALVPPQPCRDPASPCRQPLRQPGWRWRQTCPCCQCRPA